MRLTSAWPGHWTWHGKAQLASACALEVFQYSVRPHELYTFSSILATVHVHDDRMTNAGPGPCTVSSLQAVAMRRPNNNDTVVTDTIIFFKCTIIIIISALP